MKDHQNSSCYEIVLPIREFTSNETLKDYDTTNQAIEFVIGSAFFFLSVVIVVVVNCKKRYAMCRKKMDSHRSEV